MSELWTDQEWWDKRLEIDWPATKEALLSAGLPYLNPVNFVPTFSEEVDMLKVQDLVVYLGSSFAEPSKKAPEPKAKDAPKKTGRPHKKG